MTKLVNVFGCAFLLLLVAGCFGDAVARRTVSLKFLGQAGQTNVSLSVNDAQVQEALRLVEGVMVSAGYVRDTRPPAPEDQAHGFIASYGVCAVYLQGNRLDVNFVELMQRHSSKAVRKTCGLLKDKLSTRYGSERVKMED